jgi:hypothetical protein
MNENDIGLARSKPIIEYQGISHAIMHLSPQFSETIVLSFPQNSAFSDLSSAGEVNKTVTAETCKTKTKASAIETKTNTLVCLHNKTMHNPDTS